MCKRSEKRLNILLKILALSIAVFLLADNSAAQGGNGRSGAVVPPVTSGERSRKSLKHRAPKPAPRIAVRETEKSPPDTGALALSLNEGASEVYLSKVDNAADSNTIFRAPEGPSLIIRTLSPGSYTLAVRKPGFFDEARTFSIAAGKRKRVIVNLRPKMALLTVSTNVSDAEIEVEGVAKFTSSLRKYRIKPGSYHINVRRRGFLPQTATVDLKVPGQEQNLTVLLQPVRIDTMLDQAYLKINTGDLIGAAELTNDVLRLNAAHARANFIFGLAGYYKGDRSSVAYFLKAIRNGEAIQIPVRILDEIGNIKLVDADVRLDRDRISIRTAGRSDPNLIILWREVLEFRKVADQSSVAYLTLKGNGDSYGHLAEQRLTIYSSIAALPANSKEAYCPTSHPGRSCASDVEILYAVISAWRSSLQKTAAAK
jgi:hypothetical protein